MKKRMFLAAAVLSPLAFAAGPTNSCNVVECSPGEKAVTYAAKDDFYYACPTEALSDYISTALGMVSVTYQVSGKLPNISPETGEPEFQGDSKEMLDNLRGKAGVSTFDQAIAQCKKGKSKLQVTVMNNPAGGGSIWVSGADKKPFWMPKGFLDKR